MLVKALQPFRYPNADGDWLEVEAGTEVNVPDDQVDSLKAQGFIAVKAKKTAEEPSA